MGGEIGGDAAEDQVDRFVITLYRTRYPLQVVERSALVDGIETFLQCVPQQRFAAVEHVPVVVVLVAAAEEEDAGMAAQFTHDFAGFRLELAVIGLSVSHPAGDGIFLKNQQAEFVAAVVKMSFFAETAAPDTNEIHMTRAEGLQRHVILSRNNLPDCGVWRDPVHAVDEEGKAVDGELQRDVFGTLAGSGQPRDFAQADTLLEWLRTALRHVERDFQIMQVRLAQTVGPPKLRGFHLDKRGEVPGVQKRKGALAAAQGNARPPLRDFLAQFGVDGNSGALAIFQARLDPGGLHPKLRRDLQPHFVPDAEGSQGRGEVPTLAKLRFRRFELFLARRRQKPHFDLHALAAPCIQAEHDRMEHPLPGDAPFAVEPNFVTVVEPFKNEPRGFIRAGLRHFHPAPVNPHLPIHPLNTVDVGSPVKRFPREPECGRLDGSRNVDWKPTLLGRVA